MIPSLSGAIDHVHVYVPGRRAAARWYQKHLAFSVLEAYAFWATDDGGPLTIADRDDRIHLALFRAETPRPVSFALGANRTEYDAWKAHLNNAGIVFRESDHTLCHSVYFSDPYDNQIEITTYDVA